MLFTLLRTSLHTKATGTCSACIHLHAPVPIKPCRLSLPRHLLPSVPCLAPATMASAPGQVTDASVSDPNANWTMQWNPAWEYQQQLNAQTKYQQQLNAQTNHRGLAPEHNFDPKSQGHPYNQPTHKDLPPDQFPDHPGYSDLTPDQIEAYNQWKRATIPNQPEKPTMEHTHALPPSQATTVPSTPGYHTPPVKPPLLDSPSLDKPSLPIMDPSTPPPWKHSQGH